MKKTLLFLAGAALCSVLAFVQLYARASKSNIGTQLPDLNVEYVGDKAELKGKPMLVEFWATWCPPCRQSIPHLNEAHEKFSAKGLEIVGITDEDMPTVKAFLKDMPMKYHPALDQGAKLKKHFGIEGIPHAMLVDTTGKIVWEGHPMSLTDDDIKMVLK